MKTKPTKNAVIITAFLLLAALASLLFLLLPVAEDAPYTADIYQNGELLMSIPLQETAETYSFTAEGENHCVNVVQVCPGSIGIVSADCPDKLCVGQGFIRDSRLPITCLPNRLVIQLRPSSDSEAPSDLPDAITY